MKFPQWISARHICSCRSWEKEYGSVFAFATVHWAVRKWRKTVATQSHITAGMPSASSVDFPEWVVLRTLEHEIGGLEYSCTFANFCQTNEWTKKIRCQIFTIEWMSEFIPCWKFPNKRTIEFIRCRKLPNKWRVELIRFQKLSNDRIVA